MDLSESIEVAWLNIADVPTIDDAGANRSICDELFKPVRREGIDLIVEGNHTHSNLNTRLTANISSRSRPQTISPVLAVTRSSRNS
jgi:calcineurin-like phosphoesterase